MLPSPSRPAAVPWLRCPVFAARAKAACKKQTAAPAPPRLFRPQDAPRLRSPPGEASASAFSGPKQVVRRSCFRAFPYHSPALITTG